ncbi:hypothetical protein METBIDRAFT_32609 [Metschnikowia bicuspidata var. bicuspidata NRRL YB-4993]|uniref:Bud site selection protein RAX2 n=1 Tax=Metschnikowia bicuspidata var. bicuspidata NRRL YB-4993 TaxID=869754 RepID=A0A1A0H9E4_9ASCO|nr:hypothetical protein METBIDRAFT_32609 [Metschnikowia bicuspidata var. bicuspidata NRRL YB-4993]OBA20641.1 hypothetical protein METBIDRAFT_32609 [Metschnikowia bicuspidata var. bicuspidata NRRL YB-4993]
MHSTTLLGTLLRAQLVMCFALAAAAVSRPAVDFDATGGRIGLLGDFDGVSFYNAENASAFLATAPANSLALYLRNLTSGASLVVASLGGGAVSQVLRLAADAVLVLGSFSSVNGDTMTPPIIFNLSLLEATLLLDLALGTAAASGSVLATLVDGDLIYLGGDLDFNSTYGAAIYNLASGLLETLPFLGFGENASISAIAKYPPDADDGSIIFGGSFHTLGLPELLMHNVSVSTEGTSNSTNTTLIQAEQLISLKYATFLNVNGLSSNDDSAVICPATSSTWALEDASGGEWSAELPLEMQGITPTKIRIYVPDDTLNGISTFRFYTFPNNGIMNLTYVDPATNQIAYCDAWCPLQLSSTLEGSADLNVDDADSYSDDDSVYLDENGSFFRYLDSETKTRSVGYGRDFQEFALVNDILVDAFTLSTVGWYGSRGEFSGFELYLDAITVYGNDTLNELNCGSESDQASNSAVIESGTWQAVLSLTDSETVTNYLVSIVDDSSSMTLYPNISYSGDYSILFYTPGCTADGSCSERSLVNVTLIDDYDQVLSTNIIYQNNLDDKFDYLYSGHLNGSSSDNRRNRVQVDFISAIDSSATSPWVVIDKVVSNILFLDESVLFDSTNSTTNTTSSYITTMSLNGLFEYSLANFSTFSQDSVFENIDDQIIIKDTNTYVGNSTINVLSGNLSNDSSITNVVYASGSELIFLHGNLDSLDISLLNNNLITLAVDGYNSTANDTEISSITKRFVKRDDQTILGATFNDSITSIYDVDGGILALGEYTISESDGLSNLADGNSSTTTANNFALFYQNEWYSFGNSYIGDLFSQFSSIVLNGTEFFIFSTSDGVYLPWDNSNKQWSNTRDKLDITSAVSLDDEQQVIGGSSFGIMDFYERDQAYLLNSEELSSFDVAITEGSVRISYYLNETFSVIGGTFISNNSIENVALLVNDIAVPLQDTIEWQNDTFVSKLYVDTDDDLLFIGTNGSATIHNSDVAGLLVYSLTNDTFSSIQPPDLSTSDGSLLEVNALALYDQSSQLLVGGNFDFAGSLGCASVCLYDIENTRWISPYSSSLSALLSGTVTDAKFISSSSILLSGNLTLNRSEASFVMYDFGENDFETAGDNINNIAVPGTVLKFIMNDNADKSLAMRMAAIGTDFVMGYDGNTWSRIDDDIELSAQTQLTDLKLVQLSESNSNNLNETYFDRDQALLLSGFFNLTNYGMVNLALFDGTNWIPYVFTLKDSNVGNVNSLLLEELYKSQSSSDLETSTNQMTTGQVVGVSLACALGSTALLGLLYMIPIFFMMGESGRKDKSDQRIHEDEMMDIVRPEDLIHEMDAQRNY